MTTSSHGDDHAALHALIGSAQREPRARASLGLGEFLPRYLLVEAALAGRRVLEVGTSDPRSLLRILDAGAARVIGTSPEAGAFDRSRVGSHAIEMFPMDRGRVDFPDDSFDAVLVADLSRELSNNPRFLDEVRRVLSPRGFVLVGFAATGRSLTHLVSDDPALPELEPQRLERAVREAFPDARFYVQSPFIGVTIHREGEDPATLDVSLDPSLSGPEARPSHVLAIGGPDAPDPNDRTLVELPFLDFEALTEASQARSSADLKRVLEALADARRAIGQRDESLRAIGQRLPRIRAAFEERLREARSSRPPAPEVISPTVLERPTNEGTPANETFVERVPRVEKVDEVVSRLESARQDLRTRVDGLSAALDREREARQRAENKLAELESADAARWSSEEDARNVEAMHQEIARRDAAIQDLRTQIDLRDGEAERYETRISELQRTIIEQPSAPPVADDEALHEAERRIHHLERTASMQEQRIAELEQELSGQLEVRHSLGTDYRDAAARIDYLTRRLDDAAMNHAAEQEAAQERIAFLAHALSESDREREQATDRLRELELTEEALVEARRAAEVRADDAAQAYAEASNTARGLADEVDRLRLAAHQRSARIEALERELLDKSAEAQAFSGSAAARGRDKMAVELAAGHLYQEVQQLRARVQALRNERDTLAAVSQSLLEERDAAAMMAKRAIESENRARQLAESLEGGQAAIERLEREVDDANEAAEVAHTKHLSLLEENKKLVSQLATLRGRMTAAESDGTAERSRVSALDRKLAELERRLDASVAEREQAVQRKEELVELLRETSMSASSAMREARAWEERNQALEQDAKAHFDEMGVALAAKVRAEGEAAHAIWTLTHTEAERTMYRAELAAVRRKLVMLQVESEERARSEEDTTAHAAAVAEAVAAKATAETALGRTLEEAAKLSMRMSELEQALAEAHRSNETLQEERTMLARQREEAVRSERSIDAARAHAMMEAKTLADRVNRLEFEQTALVRELEARENDVLQLERALREAQAQIPPEPFIGSSLPAPAQEEEDLEILRARVAADREDLERLRTERFAALERIEALETALAIAPERQRTRETSDDESELRASTRALEEQLSVAVFEARLEAAVRVDDLQVALDIARAQLSDHATQNRVLLEERAELYERIEALESDHQRAGAATARALELAERLEAVRHDAALLSAKLDRVAAQRDAANEEIQSLTEELERSAANAHDGAKAEATLQAERQAAEQERVRLTGHIAKLEATATQHFSQVERLQEELSRHEVEASHREVEFEVAHTKLSRRVEELEQLRQDAVAERSTLEGLLQALAEQQETVEAEQASLRSSADSLRAELDAATATNGALEVELAAVRVEREELNATCARLQERIVERDDEASKLGMQKRDAEQRVEELEARQKEIEASHAQAIAAQKEAYDALQEQLQPLEDRVKILSDERVAAQEERAALEARVHALTEERSAVEAELAEAVEARDEARAERSIAAQERTRVEAEVKGLRAELDRVAADERTLREANASLEDTLEARKSALQKTELELVAARTALETLRTEADESARLAEDNDRELSQAVERLEESTKEHERLTTALAAANERLEETRASQKAFDDQQIELQRLKTDLESAATARAALEARLQDLVRAQETEASRFAETTGERDTLRALVEATKEEQDALHQKIQKLTDELAEERRSAQDRVARLAHTAGERDGLKAEVQALEKKLEAAQTRGNSGWAQAQELETARQLLEEQVAETRRQLADANPEAAREAVIRAERAESERARVQQELDEAKITIAQIEDRRSHAEMAVTKLEADVERLNADVERAEDRARHAEAYSNESENRARELEEKRKVLETRSLEAEGRAEHAERRRRQLELELEQARARLTTRAEEAEARMKTAEERFATIDGEKGLLESKLAAVERELTSSSRAQLEEALATANHRLAELESKATQSGDVEALRTRIKNLERAVADRDGEVKRLKGLAERAARELDEARAEVGRKLSEIRQGREGLEFVRRQLTQARSDSDVLRSKLDNRGDAERLRTEVESRDQQIARLTAEAAALEAERHRLRAQLEASEQTQVMTERRIAELETAVEDRERRLDRVSRELADKSERLRRLAGLSDG